MLRAKFKVWTIVHSPAITPDVCAEVRLNAVYEDGGGDNKSWSKYTPSGEIRMFITNPDAIEQFEVGKSYFVNFTPASAEG